MKIRSILTITGAIILGSLLTMCWCYVSSSGDLCFDRKYQQMLDSCMRTCVYIGKLPVTTVTEPPGCYCADYEAVKLYPIQKDY